MSNDDVEIENLVLSLHNTSTLELFVDLKREELPESGIYVRAIRVDGNERRYDDADIAHLDYNSLMRWLRSRGGDNLWAECTVALLLGHDIPIREPTCSTKT